MSKERITIHDIAKKLNLSASTVSRGLKDHPWISVGTKRKILKAAQNLNYQPNHMAAALRNGRSNILGIIVPNVDRSFFSSVVYGIEEIVNKAGYNVMICQSHEDYTKEVATIEALLNSQVDGIIASFATETKDFSHFNQVKLNGIPLILFDRAHELLDVSQVVIDDFMGAYKAVDHLIQQGCKHIAHFTGSGEVNIFKERLRGYKEALLVNKLPFDKSLVFTSNLQLEDGKRSMQRILDSKIEVDGIFSSSELGAMGALQVCKQNKISIPDQIAIVGFSNDVFSSFSEPPLTSVEQHSLQMGRVAAEMFLEQMQAKINDQPFTQKKTVLTPSLIIRESSLKKR